MIKSAQCAKSIGRDNAHQMVYMMALWLKPFI